VARSAKPNARTTRPSRGPVDHQRRGCPRGQTNKKGGREGLCRPTASGQRQKMPVFGPPVTPPSHWKRRIDQTIWAKGEGGAGHRENRGRRELDREKPKIGAPQAPSSGPEQQAPASAGPPSCEEGDHHRPPPAEPEIGRRGGGTRAKPADRPSGNLQASRQRSRRNSRVYETTVSALLPADKAQGRGQRETCDSRPAVQRCQRAPGQLDGSGPGVRRPPHASRPAEQAPRAHRSRTDRHHHNTGMMEDLGKDEEWPNA